MFDTNFGADPEIFVVDSLGNCVPPVALRKDYGLPIIKENKTIGPNGELKIVKVLLEGPDWKIIEDGAATEININPSREPSILIYEISSAMDSLTNKIRFLDKNLAVVPKVAVPFDVIKYWLGRDEEFRDCVRFGCDPDLDIYSGKYSAEIDVSNIKERFGGGHLHMQAPLKNPNLFEEVYLQTTRLMDALVGNTCTAMLRDTSISDDDEISRLKFYGRPGRIRLQQYPNDVNGIEYRVPSNFWVGNALITFELYNLMNAVFNLVQYPDDASDILDLPQMNNIPDTILSYDKKTACENMMVFIDKLIDLKYLNLDSFTRLLKYC